MPTLPDHVFAVLLAVLFPIRAAFFGYRRLTVAAPEDVPRVRLWLYRQGIAIQWLLTAVALALWTWRRRPWDALGVVPHLTWGLLGVAVGFAVIVGYVLTQRRKTIEDLDAMARLRRQMSNIQRMMPTTDHEARWFNGLALTAGICEELLYRGYLIWYLSSWMGVVPAALLASVVFGFGHAYQGPRGIALTTAVGVFLGAIYLLTGSLLAPMAIHALMDLHAGVMSRAAFASPEPAVEPEPAEFPPSEPFAGHEGGPPGA